MFIFIFLFLVAFASLTHIGPTGDIENQELLPGCRSREITAEDASVSLLGASYDQHGQRGVVGSIDAVALLRNDHFLTRRHDVGFGQFTLRSRVAHPVNLK